MLEGHIAPSLNYSYDTEKIIARGIQAFSDPPNPIPLSLRVLPCIMAEGFRGLEVGASLAKPQRCRKHPAGVIEVSPGLYCHSGQRAGIQSEWGSGSRIMLPMSEVRDDTVSQMGAVEVWEKKCRKHPAGGLGVSPKL